MVVVVGGAVTGEAGSTAAVGEVGPGRDGSDDGVAAVVATAGRTSGGRRGWAAVGLGWAVRGRRKRKWERKR